MIKYPRRSCQNQGKTKHNILIPYIFENEVELSGINQHVNSGHQNAPPPTSLISCMLLQLCYYEKLPDICLWVQFDPRVGVRDPYNEINHKCFYPVKKIINTSQ